MLRELRIENLVLIERAELQLGPGLNVFTGETGAGKTMLAQALDLLLGAKPAKGTVRPGADEAYVEGVFVLPKGLLNREEFADLCDRLPDPDRDEVVVARRILAGGRSRAFIDGRSASAGDLAALGSELVAFHGQHEHRRLTSARAQMEILDRFAGHEQAMRLEAAAELQRVLAAVAHELSALEQLAQRRERDLGLLEFELAEIEELAPDPAVEVELLAERGRLRAVEQLRAAAAEALCAFDPDDPLIGPSGAVSSLAAAAQALAAQAESDPELAALAVRSAALQVDASELSSDLRSYFGLLADDPHRLQRLDEQLDGWERLKRKHGGTLEAVIEHAARCRVERDRLAGAEIALEDALRRRSLAIAALESVSAGLSDARREAAARLAPAVEAQLRDLAIESARFEIEVAATGDAPGPRGFDRVEFEIAPNPGMPLSPMRDTASGGEMSRALLALLIAAEGDGHADGSSLVFDEIDAGIGGHTARAVGEKLRRLGLSRQVLCITHLPQVAAAGSTHFRIEKHVVAGSTMTEVVRLEGDQVVEELCRMLGASGDDQAAREHAIELRAAA